MNEKTVSVFIVLKKPTFPPPLASRGHAEDKGEAVANWWAPPGPAEILWGITDWGSNSRQQDAWLQVSLPVAPGTCLSSFLHHLPSTVCLCRAELFFGNSSLSYHAAFQCYYNMQHVSSAENLSLSLTPVPIRAWHRDGRIAQHAIFSWSPWIGSVFSIPCV